MKPAQLAAASGFDLLVGPRHCQDFLAEEAPLRHDWTILGGGFFGDQSDKILGKQQPLTRRYQIDHFLSHHSPRDHLGDIRKYMQSIRMYATIKYVRVPTLKLVGGEDKFGAALSRVSMWSMCHRIPREPKWMTSDVDHRARAVFWSVGAPAFTALCQSLCCSFLSFSATCVCQRERFAHAQSAPLHTCREAATCLMEKGYCTLVALSAKASEQTIPS